MPKERKKIRKRMRRKWPWKRASEGKEETGGQKEEKRRIINIKK